MFLCSMFEFVLLLVCFCTFVLGGAWWLWYFVFGCFASAVYVCLPLLDVFVFMVYCLCFVSRLAVYV